MKRRKTVFDWHANYTRMKSRIQVCFQEMRCKCTWFYSLHLKIL